jgi:hypothetical protein
MGEMEKKACVVFRRHKTFCSFGVINWWSFLRNNNPILIDLYQCKCTKCMVVWRDFVLQCKSNFIIFKTSHSVCRYTRENTMLLRHEQRIVQALHVNNCLVLRHLHKTHKFTALANEQFFDVTASNNVHSNIQ